MLAEENSPLSFQRQEGWDPRVHVAQCGDLVRAHLIVCERFVLVYDTLLGPKSGSWLRSQALDLGQGRPILVVNSHADWDHYFGNMSFPDTILASEQCAQRITGAVGLAELQKKRQEHPTSYDTVTLRGPTVHLQGSTTIDGGDLLIKLLPTPGHRPDHLALHLPQIATLFPGDCVEDPIPLIDEESCPSSHTIAELITSLEMMLALKPAWVLANHAPAQAGTTRIEANLSYLRRLQQEADRAPNLENLQQAFPANPSWATFYQKAHQSHLQFAWEQITRFAS